MSSINLIWVCVENVSDRKIGFYLKLTLKNFSVNVSFTFPHCLILTVLKVSYEHAFLLLVAYGFLNRI